MCLVALLYYFIVLPQLRSLLLRSLQQSPWVTSLLLDRLQSKYACCGILSQDDFTNLPLDPKPSSCCRVPNCWRDTDINDHNGSNNTMSLMHSTGCYPIVERYITIELWILLGIAGLCALLQLFAILFMCTLYQRYKEFDDNPKFVINHLASGVPIDPNHNKNNPFQSSTQTIEETVEITQI